MIIFFVWFFIWPSEMRIFFLLSMWSNLISLFYIPYVRHYNPRFVYFKPTFWRSKMFFQKILLLCMASIQERFVIKSGLSWRTHGMPEPGGGCQGLQFWADQFSQFQREEGKLSPKITTDILHFLHVLLKNFFLYV